MRKPNRKSTVAVLRSITGLDQVGFAKQIGYKAATVAGIESGRNPITEKFALKISSALDADFKWLMDGDVSKPPITRTGAPYTLRRFEEMCSLNSAASKPGFVNQTTNAMVKEFFLPPIAAKLHAILASAINGGEFTIALYRVQRMLAELEADFELDQATYASYGPQINSIQQNLAKTMAEVDKRIRPSLKRPSAK